MKYILAILLILASPSLASEPLQKKQNTAYGQIEPCTRFTYQAHGVVFSTPILMQGNIIPQDLMSHIYHMNPYDLEHVRNLKLVSRGFANFVDRLPHLIIYPSVTPEQFLTLIGYKTNLQSLDLRCCWQLRKETFLAATPLFGKVTQLNLSRTRCNDQDLATILRGCPQLTKLDLSHCRQISEEGLQQMPEYRPELEELSLVGMQQMNGQIGIVLAKGLKKLRTIDLLTGEGPDSGMFECGKVTLREYLTMHEQNSSLQVVNYGLKPDNIEQFLAVLRAHQNLPHLHLQFPYSIDALWHTRFNNLRSLTLFLTLYHNNYAIEGLDQLLIAAPQLTKFHIFVRELNIEPPLTRVIKGYCRQLTDLALRLPQYDLGNDFMSALQLCTNLTSLDFSCYTFGENFTRTFQPMTKLTVLKLRALVPTRDYNISDIFVCNGIKLKEKLTKLWIITHPINIDPIIMESCPNLEELVLLNGKIEKADHDRFARSLARLKTLSLENYDIDNGLLESLGKYCRSLIYFELCNNQQDISGVYSIIKSNPHLQQLHLPYLGYATNSPGYEQVKATLTALKNLNELHLASRGFLKVEELVRIVRGIPSLAGLVFDWPYYTEDAKLFRKIPTLTVKL